MMMSAKLVALVVLVASFAACGGRAAISPTSPSTVAAVAAPTGTTTPPLSGPSRTFTFERSLLATTPMLYTQHSKFVLYDNGAFVLVTPFSLGQPEYRGTFTENNGSVTFQWEGWSTAGPWGATGTLAGSTLTVRYNLVMQLTDFEDAVYRQQ